MFETDFIGVEHGLIGEFVDRPRRGHGIVARKRSKTHGARIDPQTADLGLFAHDDGSGRAFDNDDHVVGPGLGTRLHAVLDRTEDQDFGAGEARRDRNLPGGGVSLDAFFRRFGRSRAA